VTGVIFQDTNADGQFQDGEAVMSGWVVWADVDGNGSHDAAEPAGTTGPDGRYALSGVPPGMDALVARPSEGAACPDQATCTRSVVVSEGAPAVADFPLPGGGQILLDDDPPVLIGKVALTVPRGCRRTPFAVALAGAGVTRVDFSVDGRLAKSVRRPAKDNRFVARINPRKLHRGRHKLTAAVWFSRVASAPGKRVNATFRSCGSRRR
jgi:hypothetical protein